MRVLALCVLLTGCAVDPYLCVPGANIYQYQGAEYLTTQPYLFVYVRCEE